MPDTKIPPENIRPMLPYDGMFLRGQPGAHHEHAAVRSWEFSHTFGRWGAFVTFDDGYECYTYPDKPAPPAPFYAETGETTEDGWVKVRSPVFPQEFTVACPTCGSRRVMMQGGAVIKGVYHAGFSKCCSCGRYVPDTSVPK